MWCVRYSISGPHCVILVWVHTDRDMLFRAVSRIVSRGVMLEEQVSWPFHVSLNAAAI